jgi:hypothetical protein
VTARLAAGRWPKKSICTEVVHLLEETNRGKLWCTFSCITKNVFVSASCTTKTQTAMTKAIVETFLSDHYKRICLNFRAFCCCYCGFGCIFAFMSHSPCVALIFVNAILFSACSLTLFIIQTSNWNAHLYLEEEVGRFIATSTQELVIVSSQVCRELFRTTGLMSSMTTKVKLQMRCNTAAIKSTSCLTTFLPLWPNL